MEELFCPTCGHALLVTSRQYMTCPQGHGRLVARPEGLRRTSITAAQRHSVRAAARAALPLATRLSNRHGRPGRFYALEGQNGHFCMTTDRVTDCPVDCLVAIYRGRTRTFRMESTDVLAKNGSGD